MFKIKFKAKIKPIFRPARAWRLLMGTFLILVLATFIGGYSAYGWLADLEVSSQRRLEQETVSASRLDLKTLAEISAEFNAKAAQIKALKFNPPTIANPNPAERTISSSR